MKIIGQPESYSDMLQRIFWLSFISGILCTFILASASPQVREFLDSFHMQADVGYVKGLKALYVLVPLLIGLISRIIRLHDRISDLIGLRFRFDTLHILFPMVAATGHELTPEIQKAIRASREVAMYQVFYPYASFADPRIDKQLVRTAADNWGWFWSATEASVLFLITAIILFVVDKRFYAQFCGVVFLLLSTLQVFLWFACRRSASREVAAITADGERKSAIRNYFSTLLSSLSPR